MGKLNAHIIPVMSFRQNCRLLFDDENKKGVLIDPGGDLSHILEAIDITGVIVEAIWLTHGHIDHAGASMDAKDALGVEIIGPQIGDKILLDQLVETAEQYDLCDPVRNCVPSRWLKDGDIVICGGHILKVLHSPGHSPGHVIYFSEDERFAIVGDVLFRGSIGRTDLPYSNHDDLMHSLYDKLLPLGDDVSFLCGHGLGGYIGEERHTNPFLTRACRTIPIQAEYLNQ
ncbi:MAG: Beta-lactamase domain-containing protein [Candidatus Tokpelaia sp. JSC189]|nr:MAG: Beta-lactamase domain-containing protein [Candidatus Tokpelaia sp. JSC189]